MFSLKLDHGNIKFVRSHAFLLTSPCWSKGSARGCFPNTSCPMRSHRLVSRKCEKWWGLRVLHVISWKKLIERRDWDGSWSTFIAVNWRKRMRLKGLFKFTFSRCQNFTSTPLHLHCFKYDLEIVSSKQQSDSKVEETCQNKKKKDKPYS